MSKAKTGRGTNGAAPPNGRLHGKLFEITLPDSGVTLRYKRLRQALMMQINRDFPPPEPPVVEVTYGEGDVRREPNPEHPDYLKALAQHEKDLTWIGIATAIEEGVVCEVPHNEVQAFRERYRERTRTASRPEGVALSGSDKLVYVMHLAAETDEDLEALLEAIRRASEPTEAAIAEATATFPAEVQGQEPAA